MLVAAGAPFVLRTCGPISSEVRLAHRALGRLGCAGGCGVLATLVEVINSVATLFFDCFCLPAAGHPAQRNKRTLRHVCEHL
jgi:hypothetical protein